LAVFNSSEWDTGRNVWHPSTLKSQWLLVGISVSVMMPTLTSLAVRRLSRASSLPEETIPSLSRSLRVKKNPVLLASLEVVEVF
jgi:hypothetical protein